MTIILQDHKGSIMVLLLFCASPNKVSSYTGFCLCSCFVSLSNSMLNLLLNDSSCSSISLRNAQSCLLLGWIASSLSWGTQHSFWTYLDQVQVVCKANEVTLVVRWQTFLLLENWFPRNQKLPVKMQGVLQRHCQIVRKKVTKGIEI